MKLEELSEQQLERLSHAKFSELVELAKELGISQRTAYYWKKRIFNYLQGTTIVPKLKYRENKKKKISLKNGAKTITIGIVADTHINSYYERLDLLNEAYTNFENRGIQIVFHAGNIIDGYSRLNALDVRYSSLDRQIAYLSKVYPKFSGKTYFITADEHESWAANLVGINVGQRIEDLCKRLGRDDLIYIGSVENDVHIEDYTIRIVHPGRGVTKGISLRFQQIVEDYEEDSNKPNLLIVGHYHKMLYLPWHGVDALGCPSFQDTNRYFKKNRIKSQLGYWILTIDLEHNRLQNIEPYHFERQNVDTKGVWINRSIVADDKEQTI